ncbi:MAG: branched-chain amino acid ABC transporter permease [Planctomycetota bacterium]|jgi:branched-chain amino acid transport system permease protein|nr:branched-chain amino acid ABC transporter permease [Planctomycetota bacterium]
MQYLILILNGVSHAALLFILGSGLTLAFGLMNIVNMAHGAFYLFGGYMGYSLFSATGSWILGMAAGMTSAVIVGGMFERFLLEKVRGNALTETLLTISLSMIMADVCLAIWGGFPKSLRVPAYLRPRIDVSGFIYPGFRYFLIVLAIAIGIFLFILLHKTRIGAAIRAGVDDRETVSAMGINVNRVFFFVFLLAAALAGMAGVLGGSFLSLAPGADSQNLTLSLVVIIIGGKGSIKGTAVGALLIGLLLSAGRAFIPEFSYFLVFAPMVLVLAFKPQGMFGREAA